MDFRLLGHTEKLGCTIAELRAKPGQRKKKGGGKVKRFYYFSKEVQTYEFKYKFEFNKSKIMHHHVCNNHQAFYLIHKTNECFFFTIFSVKKVNVGKFRTERKLLLNFSSWSHPKIWKFQGVSFKDLKMYYYHIAIWM
jgi:hypothetical protein